MVDLPFLAGSQPTACECLISTRPTAEASNLRVLAEEALGRSIRPTSPARRSRLSVCTSLPLVIGLLVVMSTTNVQASDSLENLSVAPPALAFARYIAFLHQRSPFTESGPVAVEINASLPRLGKQACLSAIREIGASERSEYQVLQSEGDSVVKQQVIARYLSAQAQAEALPLSSVLITPANYRFHYVGSLHSLGAFLYAFRISPRKKRVGLIQGQLWIDPTAGVPVYAAGHLVSTPSVLLLRIEIARDTTVGDRFSYVRVTRLAIEMHRSAGRAELTMTERPLRVAHRTAASVVDWGER